MTQRPRRNHSSAFRAKVAVAAIESEKNLDLAGAGFRRSPKPDQTAAKAMPEPVINVKTLYAKIRELTLKNIVGPARSPRRVSCKAQKTIDPTAKLSVSHQAIMLRISRGSKTSHPARCRTTI